MRFAPSAGRWGRGARGEKGALQSSHIKYSSLTLRLYTESVRRESEVSFLACTPYGPSVKPYIQERDPPRRETLEKG